MGSPIDVSAMWRRTSNDSDVLKIVVQIFLDELPRTVISLKAAIAAADLDSLQKTAHRTKGSLVIFGAQAAIEAAETLEELAGKGDLNEASFAASMLESKLDEVAAAISQFVNEVVDDAENQALSVASAEPAFRT